MHLIIQTLIINYINTFTKWPAQKVFIINEVSNATKIPIFVFCMKSIFPWSFLLSVI